MGGSPNARIDAVLREDKGFTYGIRATFRPRRREGLFLVSGSVRADATVEGLGLLLDILDRGRDGFTAEETRAGVDFIHKTAPGRYATADAVADEASTMALEGLSTEFTTANLLDLATVDAERLSAAYRRFVTGDWTVVVVGDAERYADGVRGLVALRRWAAQALAATIASSSTCRPSSSSSSLMTSGGSSRMTLP